MQSALRDINEIKSSVTTVEPLLHLLVLARAVSSALPPVVLSNTSCVCVAC